MKKLSKKCNQQKYENLEYIIIDGFNDDTLQIVEKYKEKVTKIISEPDKGIYDAFNKGLKFSTGDLIGFIKVTIY